MDKNLSKKDAKEVNIGVDGIIRGRERGDY
jgi:hypothetical protein